MVYLRHPLSKDQTYQRNQSITAKSFGALLEKSFAAAIIVSMAGAGAASVQTSHTGFSPTAMFPNPAAGTVVKFDAPGLGLQVEYTQPTAINSTGTVIGYSLDVNLTYAGFVRTPDGKVVSFAAPGAGTGSAQGTYPLSINKAGEIVGDVITAQSIAKGFVRSPSGAFRVFALLSCPQGTDPSGVNATGALTGTCYVTRGGSSQGFVVMNGATSYSQVPGSISTSLYKINASNTAIGTYLESPNYQNNRGVIRNADGTLVTIDVPGSVSTTPIAINTSGLIAGSWVLTGPEESAPLHGFVRTKSGRFTTFDYPGATSTSVSDVNEADSVVGGWSTSNVLGAYERLANGTVVDIAVPGAASVGASAINDSAVVTGSYAITPYGFSHGYVVQAQ